MGLLAQILGSLAGRSATSQQRSDALLDMATAIIQGHPGGLTVQPPEGCCHETFGAGALDRTVRLGRRRRSTHAV